MARMTIENRKRIGQRKPPCDAEESDAVEIVADSVTMELSLLPSNRPFPRLPVPVDTRSARNGVTVALDVFMSPRGLLLAAAEVNAYAILINMVCCVLSCTTSLARTTKMMMHPSYVEWKSQKAV